MELDKDELIEELENKLAYTNLALQQAKRTIKELEEEIDELEATSNEYKCCY